MKLKTLTIVLVLLFAAGAVAASDFAFYSIVQKIFRAQGLHVNYDHMNFLESGGKRYFILTMESRRTDIDRIMLVSFYASGLAIRQTRERIDGVNVVMTISRKDDERIMVSAGITDIINLIDKKISSEQFVNTRVTFY